MPTPLRIILVNYRCIELIDAQLRSGVFRQADVVLVDNNSDPERVTQLAAEHKARAILLPENIGFAGAVNKALELPVVDGNPIDAVLLLNPDVELHERQLSTLLDALLESDADAVGPVLADDEGRLWVSSAGGPISLRSVVWYFLGLSHIFPWLSGFFWTRHQLRSSRPKRPHWLCGACLLVSMPAFARFGGLPTDEIVYGEDVAWGADVVARGGSLHLVRDLVVTHAGGQSGGSSAWTPATSRLFRRRLGPIRGNVAAACLQLGLAVRRLVRSYLHR